MDEQQKQPYKDESFYQRLYLFSSPYIIKKEFGYSLLFLSFFFSSLLLFDLGSSFDPHSFFRFDFISRILPYNKRLLLLPSSTSQFVCDYSNGRWVHDETYPLRLYNESCPFLDPGFRCKLNGRMDDGYRKWRWQPDGCDLPRFNATDFLERSMNGRIVFAGDSIGRNQWESLICMLSQVVSNHSTIYEVNGRPITKHKGFLSINFQQYNLTVEYYRAPFLVLAGRPPRNSSIEVHTSVRVDELHWFSKKWEGANLLVFNGGHWWNKDKTLKMGCYFQEGGKVNKSMDVIEAFQKSLQTLMYWAVSKLDPDKTHIFFRSYSPVHFRNGTWDEGGQCDINNEPEGNYTRLEADPVYNLLISRAIKQIDDGTRKVQFLNITYLSEFRKDGHPSKFREPGTPALAPQDCSHWCLPGVPDTWNELLYAHLLSKDFRTK